MPQASSIRNSRVLLGSHGPYTLHDSEFELNFHEHQKECLSQSIWPYSIRKKPNTLRDMPLLDAASRVPLEAVLVLLRFLSM